MWDSAHCARATIARWKCTHVLRIRVRGGRSHNRSCSSRARQVCLAAGEYVYANSLRSIALRAHAILVASECIQTTSKVSAVLVRDKLADGRFSYGYGRCPVLVEYAGAAVLALVSVPDGVRPLTCAQ